MSRINQSQFELDNSHKVGGPFPRPDLCVVWHIYPCAPNQLLSTSPLFSFTSLLPRCLSGLEQMSRQILVDSLFKLFPKWVLQSNVDGLDDLAGKPVVEGFRNPILAARLSRKARSRTNLVKPPQHRLQWTSIDMFHKFTNAFFRSTKR